MENRSLTNIVIGAMMKMKKSPSYKKRYVQKPHNGRIVDWKTKSCFAGIGYYITGIFLDHPYYKGERGHTSYVVARRGMEIETCNSRYTLVQQEDIHEAV